MGNHTHPSIVDARRIRLDAIAKFAIIFIVTHALVVLAVALVVALGRLGRGVAARLVLFTVLASPLLVTDALGTNANAMSRT